VQAGVLVSELKKHSMRYRPEVGLACSADAGGPALAQIDGKWRLVGLSAGRGDGTAGFDCRNDAFTTRIDRSADWLKHVGLLGGLRDRRCSKDGFCDGACLVDLDCESLMCKGGCPPNPNPAPGMEPPKSEEPKPEPSNPTPEPEPEPEPKPAQTPQSNCPNCPPPPPPCLYVDREVVGERCIYKDRYSGQVCFDARVICPPRSADGSSCFCPF
jgi:hypothetical protein